MRRGRWGQRAGRCGRAARVSGPEVLVCVAGGDGRRLELAVVLVVVVDEAEAARLAGARHLALAHVRVVELAAVADLP